MNADQAPAVEYILAIDMQKCAAHLKREKMVEICKTSKNLARLDETAENLARLDETAENLARLDETAENLARLGHSMENFSSEMNNCTGPVVTQLKK